MQFRSGREAYPEKYKRALELHADGKTLTEIATELAVSYSAVYHWVKGIRIPSAGNLKEFEALLKNGGPKPVAEIKERFPKHNELFHTATQRGLSIRRYVLAQPRAFGELATWYYTTGQENDLKNRIKTMLDMLSKTKEK